MEAWVDEGRFAALREMGEDDADFLPDLVAVFLEQSRKTVTESQSQIASLDLAGLARSAHSLKGSSANIGAPILAELAREIEILAKGGKGAEAFALAGRAEAALARTAEEMKKRLP